MAAKKSVTKKTIRRSGRPKGSKNKKKPGRPKKKARHDNSITLPVNTTMDINYCSELVAFLNGNTGKSFTVVMDGGECSLVAS